MPKIDKKIKKDKKVKKIKDKNAPKKGMTAFLYYIQDQKNDYKEKNPKLAHKEVISALGKIWQSLDQQTKKPFEEKAQSDRQRYEKEKSAYQATLTKKKDSDQYQEE